MTATTPPDPDSKTDDTDDMDPGLARERTELAWRRTAISFGAVGAAALKLKPIAGIPIIAAAAAVWILGSHSAHPARIPPAARRRLMFLIAVAGTLVALTGLVVAIAVAGPVTDPG